MSAPTQAASAGWADFVEPSFPFFDSIVDARQAGPSWPKDNLTPRGIVLNLGHGQWACFDTDLLRLSAAWTGNAVTPRSMAQASYHVGSGKSRLGEGALPAPGGSVWWATGLYPGWQWGSEPNLTDPRSPAPSANEVGRGPLPDARFQSLELTGAGVTLHSEAYGTAIDEQWSGGLEAASPTLSRKITIGPSAQPLLLIAGIGPAAALRTDERTLVHWIPSHPVRCIRIEPHIKSLSFEVVEAAASPLPLPPRPKGATPHSHPTPHDAWPEVITTHATLSSATAAYVVDDIPLPLTNPWHRNVRPADIQFLPNGRAAVVTFDGDVWLVDGLSGDLRDVRWKRFASGFNEPLSLAVRGGAIYVFDRNGIWELRDRTHRGEADAYTLFSNAFAQSADSREFPNGIRLAPDGSFVIAKGGEQSEILGKLNGTVLRVAPDGRSFTVLGWGFRQPFIGVNPRTGWVTASDQEGNYVPATPLYGLDRNGYHGYLAPFQPPERYPAPIEEPLTWIPHNVAPSAVTQTWGGDARFGPLAGSLLLVSYNYPELFHVLVDRSGPPAQAAVTSLTRDFRFPPLSGSANPADGQLYLAGFRIYGTASDRIGGLARVRYTGHPFDGTKAVVPSRGGILVTFEEPIDPDSLTAAPFSADRWNYRRTPAYGSFDYRADGSVGEDELAVAGVRLSADGRTCLVETPDLTSHVMQVHLRWRCRTATGRPIQGDVYFTPRSLRPLDPIVQQFPRIAQTRQAHAAATPQDQGHQLYLALGCMSCHSDDGAARIGPTWKGLYGSTVPLSNGSTVVADDAYLRRHLARHPKEIVRGFPNAMPDYATIVSPAQANALIRYLQSLQ